MCSCTSSCVPYTPVIGSFSSAYTARKRGVCQRAVSFFFPFIYLWHNVCLKKKKVMWYLISCWWKRICCIQRDKRTPIVYVKYWPPRFSLSIDSSLFEREVCMYWPTSLAIVGERPMMAASVLHYQSIVRYIDEWCAHIKSTTITGMKRNGLLTTKKKRRRRRGISSGWEKQVFDDEAAGPVYLCTHLLIAPAARG